MTVISNLDAKITSNIRTAKIGIIYYHPPQQNLRCDAYNCSSEHGSAISLPMEHCLSPVFMLKRALCNVIMMICEGLKALLAAAPATSAVRMDAFTVLHL